MALLLIAFPEQQPVEWFSRDVDPIGIFSEDLTTDARTINGALAISAAVVNATASPGSITGSMSLAVAPVATQIASGITGSMSLSGSASIVGRVEASLDYVYSNITSLVNHWKLDDTAAPIVSAVGGAAGNTNNAVPAFSQTPLVTDGGTAISTDGNTTAFTLPTTGVGTAVSGWIAFWFATTDTADASLGLLRDSTTGAGTGWIVNLGAVGSVWSGRVAGTTWTSTTDSDPYRDGNRHFMVFQTDGTNVELWLDRVRVYTWVKAANWSTVVTPWFFGRGGLSTGIANFFANTYDDVAIGAGALLTSQQIADLWAAGIGAVVIDGSISFSGTVNSSQITAAPGSITGSMAISSSTVAAKGVASGITGSMSLSGTANAGTSLLGAWAKYIRDLIPVAWYRVGETVGATTLVDSGPNAHNGNTPSGATLGLAGLIADGDTALAIGSSDTFLSSATWMDTTAAWTGFCLVKTSTTGSERIAWSRATNNLTYAWQLGISSGNKGLVRGKASSTNLVTGATTISDGAWHLLVGVWDGSTLALYVDGQPEGTPGGLSGSLATGSPLHIGGRGGVAQWTPGDGLDELGFLNYALTSTQVSDMWAAITAAGAVNGSMSLSGTAVGSVDAGSLTGSLVISGGTPVAGGGATGVTGSLDISGTAAARGAAAATGTFDISGTTVAGARVTTGITGTVSVSGTVNAAGRATGITGSMSVAGTTAAQAQAVASGSVVVVGTTNAQAQAAASGSFAVTGIAAAGALVTAAAGTLDITGVTSAQAATTAAGSLDVSAVTDAGALASAVGAMVLSALADAGGAAGASGSFDLSADAAATRGSDITGDLAVVAHADAGGGAGPSGSVSMSATVFAGGGFGAQGNLVISAVLNAQAVAEGITGSLTITALADVGGAATSVVATIDVVMSLSGVITFDSTIYLNGVLVPASLVGYWDRPTQHFYPAPPLTLDGYWDADLQLLRTLLPAT